MRSFNALLFFRGSGIAAGHSGLAIQHAALFHGQLGNLYITIDNAGRSHYQLTNIYAVTGDIAQQHQVVSGHIALYRASLADIHIAGGIDITNELTIDADGRSTLDITGNGVARTDDGLELLMSSVFLLWLSSRSISGKSSSRSPKSIICHYLHCLFLVLEKQHSCYKPMHNIWDDYMELAQDL